MLGSTPANLYPLGPTSKPALTLPALPKSFVLLPLANFMHPAPLQLENYFVVELQFLANAEFDPRTPIILQAEDFQVTVDCQPVTEQSWSVLLRLNYEPEMAARIPCHFHLGVFGSFRVVKGYPAEGVERLVHTNGPSILYSLSREITRSVTVMGPALALSLPPMSFYRSPESRDKLPESSKAQAAEKTKPAKGRKSLPKREQ